MNEKYLFRKSATSYRILLAFASRNYLVSIYQDQSGHKVPCVLHVFRDESKADYLEDIEFFQLAWDEDEDEFDYEIDDYEEDEDLFEEEDDFEELDDELEDEFEDDYDDLDIDVDEEEDF